MLPAVIWWHHIVHRIVDIRSARSCRQARLRASAAAHSLDGPVRRLQRLDEVLRHVAALEPLRDAEDVLQGTGNRALRSGPSPPPSPSRASSYAWTSPTTSSATRFDYRRIAALGSS